MSNAIGYSFVSLWGQGLWHSSGTEKIEKSFLIDDSNHSEDSCLKITKSGVVKSRISVNNIQVALRSCKTFRSQLRKNNFLY